MTSARAAWDLDPTATFVNHGSFGACPRAVLAYQSALRDRLERQPVDFFVRWLPGALAQAREALAAFLGADPDGLAFVDNATTGVNTVLRSLTLAPGDALLVTDHAYPACRNALDFVASRAGAEVVVARLPFPCPSADAVEDAVLTAVTPRTRVALLDHVTSATGLVLPIARLVRRLADLGVDTLVDGAHAPGMLPLDLTAVGAAWYTGNCHKWLCAPKGSAFLYARADRRAALHPLVISHGYASAPSARFRAAFDWVGTRDPTPWLSVPKALEVVAALHPAGWPGLMADNRAKVLAARASLAAALDVALPCPDALIGSLATVALPDGDAAALNRALWERHRIEAQITTWPAPPRRWLRLSAQAYNTPDDYARLIEALARLGVARRASSDGRG